MFTNEEIKKTFPDWGTMVQGMVANFRVVYSKFIDDPWIEGLVNELKSESKEFELLWSKHNVEVRDNRIKDYSSPSCR